MSLHAYHVSKAIEHYPMNEHVSEPFRSILHEFAAPAIAFRICRKCGSAEDVLATQTTCPGCGASYCQCDGEYSTDRESPRMSTAGCQLHGECQNCMERLGVLWDTWGGERLWICATCAAGF